MARKTRPRGQSKTGAAVDATDGSRSDLSEAQDVQAESRTSRLPLSFKGYARGSSESSLGIGHHVHSDGARLFVLGGGARLVQQVRGELAIIEHVGRHVLPRRFGRGVAARHAGNLQH